MILLASLLSVATVAAVADPDTMMKTAADQAAAVCADNACGAPPRRSPYRLDPNADIGYDLKAAALAITGQDCDRIGKLLCTSKPMQVYSTAY